MSCKHGCTCPECAGRQIRSESQSMRRLPPARPLDAFSAGGNGALEGPRPAPRTGVEAFPPRWVRRYPESLAYFLSLRSPE